MDLIQLLAMVIFCNQLASNQPLEFEMGAQCVTIREYLVQQQGGYLEYRQWVEENRTEAEKLAEQFYE